jgi:hypothetical protein
MNVPSMKNTRSAGLEMLKGREEQTNKTYRLEAYATLHPRVVAVGARNSRQEAFRDIA